TKRLYAAGATVDPTADIGRRADPLRHAGALQHFYRRTALGPLGGAFYQRAHDLVGMRRLNPAVAGGVAPDAIFIDQIEHRVGGLADGVDQQLTLFAAEHSC